LATFSRRQRHAPVYARRKRNPNNSCSASDEPALKQPSSLRPRRRWLLRLKASSRSNNMSSSPSASRKRSDLPVIARGSSRPSSNSLFPPPSPPPSPSFALRPCTSARCILLPGETFGPRSSWMFWLAGTALSTALTRDGCKNSPSSAGRGVEGTEGSGRTRFSGR